MVNYSFRVLFWSWQACQCCEMDILIPLQYRPSKLILVGDPEQLPATVISTKARELLYGRSMFDRLYKFFKVLPRHERPVHLLELQYRMHPEIALFPAEHVYNKAIRNDSSVEKRHFPLQVPYAVFDTVTSSEHNDRKGKQQFFELVLGDVVNDLEELCLLVVYDQAVLKVIKLGDGVNDLEELCLLVVYDQVVLKVIKLGDGVNDLEELCLLVVYDEVVLKVIKLGDGVNDLEELCLLVVYNQVVLKVIMLGDGVNDLEELCLLVVYDQVVLKVIKLGAGVNDLEELCLLVVYNQAVLKVIKLGDGVNDLEEL
ncbi:predicted protein [Nematostella vectensis]|uniref:Uncharacterized protein n=1 Tax=Nematostella vectensis TaxID=45351 RepID=A7S6C5_NEMVE|nr:predicted protein [Nematostella vectensis]|eukprot:XP_001632789.1 predicted protein [Nematostella vectensis]